MFYIIYGYTRSDKPAWKNKHQIRDNGYLKKGIE